MLNRWIHPKAHDFLHVLGLVVLAFGLPFNKVLMSIGAIWGVSNLLLEGNFKSYWNNLKYNPLFWIVFSLFGLEIIGLFWTSNIGYGLDDIRKKLPLLALPLTLFARPLKSKRDLHLIFIFFIGSVLLCSLVNIYQFYFLEVSSASRDSREISIFISHIRFAIMLIISIVICANFLVKNKKNRLLLIALIIWFLFYTYLSQVLTGVLSLIAIIYAIVHYFSFQNKFIRIVLFVLPFVVFLLIPSFLIDWNNDQTPPPDSTKLSYATKNGNPYFHDLESNQMENGEYILINICEKELNEEWSKNSTFDFDSLDAKGQILKFTLFRYMTFLHLKKDAEGILKMKENDFRAVENGFATPAYLKTGLKGRIADLEYQMMIDSDPNGHSLLQRLEYWKAGTKIITSNWLFGVGTGDVNDKFQAHYSKTKSKLLPEYRLRAHNTFLTQFATYGIVGALSLILLFWFALKNQFLKKNLFSFIILWIFLLTFFIEDTLETQAGVSLFALFISLILSDRSDDFKKE